jgi:Uma2 family endonuclease
MSARAENTYRRHRLTVADYHRMGEAGVFAHDARVELIEGQVIDMAPIGSRHARAVNYFTMHLVEAVRRSAVVAVQNPVTLDEHTEVQPDVAVLRMRADLRPCALGASRGGHRSFCPVHGLNNRDHVVQSPASARSRW